MFIELQINWKLNTKSYYHRCRFYWKQSRNIHHKHLQIHKSIRHGLLIHCLWQDEWAVRALARDAENLTWSSFVLKIRWHAFKFYVCLFFSFCVTSSEHCLTYLNYLLNECRSEKPVCSHFIHTQQSDFSIHEGRCSIIYAWLYLCTMVYNHTTFSKPLQYYLLPMNSEYKFTHISNFRMLLTYNSINFFNF